MTTNKFNLNEEFHAATEGVIATIEVTYDIETDKLNTNIGIRNDFGDEELLRRVALGIEHALRDKSLYYGLSMQQLESKAGLPATHACGCTEGDHIERHA